MASVEWGERSDLAQRGRDGVLGEIHSDAGGDTTAGRHGEAGGREPLSQDASASKSTGTSRSQWDAEVEIDQALPLKA